MDEIINDNNNKSIFKRICNLQKFIEAEALARELCKLIDYNDFI